ncbi:ABC transporter ATP-binding protein [Rosenbergiella australiborealis]|uniref:ABC transporter ATP-binding protein n=1 Tax=Rosenbergiella australiborealis TaxID=1544696 RepID=A0ABS5T2Y8_9GAMM|nr:ABC transporter ATP-binding protein [Rosenbergiella australiborealis]MBT0726686.1 ABC transporter ATP-binding protein [Rosenbergiella australiborealis]
MIVNFTPVTPVVVVDNLQVSAINRGRETVLVSDIRFSVNKGEVLALIGESGSGKTTIAMALMGYARHGCQITDGRITVAGQDVRAMTPSALRQFRGNKIAYIAQSAASSFNPGIKIMDQVIEPVVIHHLMSRADAKAKAIDLFRELALPSPETIGDRYPHQVSGGQLQRLMTAMALMGDPQVIILDEPTTALDVTTQVEVLKAFRRVVTQRGMTAIYVSHDLAVVAQMADQIMVLQQGKIVEHGATSELLHHAREPYTHQLMNAAQHQSRPSSWNRHNDDVQPLLEVRDLAVGYGPRNPEGIPKIRIVEAINLQLWRGQAIGIIGESGSGKTTLAHAIAGLNPAWCGHLLFDDHYISNDLAARRPKEMQQIQYVFQMADTALNPAHTIRDILSRPLKHFHQLQGAALDKEILDLLALVKLPTSLLHRKPASLSGGQKQRVNLARALAARPDLIICDEVTSALDTVVAAAILDLIAELRRKLHLSVLFISHDMHAIRAVCDDIIVMKQGRVMTQIATEDYNKPSSHLYFERLKRAVPELRQGWLDEHQETLKAELYN